MKRAFILLSLFLFAASANAAKRPNIVMIISDDQTYRDFGFMGNPHVQTPNLDRLASQSARYVNAYVPTSVCSPSLATLLTGLYPHQHGIHYNHPPPGNSAFNRMTSRSKYEAARSPSFELIKSQPTLPRTLAQNGYRCLQTGKFWEGHYRNAGFTDGMTTFTPVPGQTFGGNRKLASGEMAAHGNGDWGLKIGRETMKPIFDFIDECGDTKPFFVWYAPYLPHQPHDSPEKFYKLYEDDPNVPKNHIPYYAACSQFDDTVGRLINHVEAKGLADNTIFILVVDNGWTPGNKRARKRPQEFDHTKESKRSPFEEGLRTPILFRWDGRVKPATHEALCNSVDITPTVLDMAGMNGAMPNLPGVNLAPSAFGKEQLKSRPVFGEIYPGDATSLGHPSQDIAYRWVRMGDHKLIVTHSEKGKPAWNNYLRGDALFNLAQDPTENKNLIQQQKLQPKIKRMRKLLNAWWTPGNDSDLRAIIDRN